MNDCHCFGYRLKQLYLRVCIGDSWYRNARCEILISSRDEYITNKDIVSVEKNKLNKNNLKISRYKRTDHPESNITEIMTPSQKKWYCIIQYN